jgi:hypothetical protein
MTIAADPASPADPLRLRSCPQCEYALEGLPDEGVCPECGFRYDRSIIIVRCQGRDVSRLNTSVLGAVTILGGSAVVAILLLRPRFFEAFTQMLVMLGFFAVLCAIAWLDRVTSPRAGAWLLWVAPEGIGLQTEFDPDSLVARLRKAVTLAMMPLYSIAGFIPMIAHGGPYWLVFLAAALAFGFLMFGLQVAMLAKPTVPASNPRPALYDWGTVSRIELTEKKAGRYRIFATNRSWISKNLRLIDAMFEGPPELAEQLRQRITQFSGKSCNLSS